jgi:hypothetical protein
MGGPQAARHPATSMANESTKTVLVSLGAGLAIALTKVGAAAVTGSSAMAAEASHSLADTANDLLLFVAQRTLNRCVRFSTVFARSCTLTPEAAPG